MVQYIITPWRSQAELLQVRERLYPHHTGKSLNEADRRHAVAQVSVWMQRGNCPHLVESSAIIISAILNDVPGNSTYCVRAAYSAAFCRFVTGLLDSHQDRRRKLSMYSIAKTIGLPATYVELRHQATHEELPSLSKLRIASQKALRWIWDYYWARLSASETPKLASDDCRTFVKKLLDDNNEQTRRKLESDLENWGADQLLETLAAIQDSTDDTQVLLRCLELQKIVLERDSSSNEIEENTGLDQDSRSLDRLRAELSKISSALDEETNKPQSEVQATEPRKESDVKGWAIWEGPWVPKPIGV